MRWGQLLQRRSKTWNFARRSTCDELCSCSRWIKLYCACA